MCDHQPPCPSGTDPSGLRARIVASHPEQGWYLLCNGVVLFDDGGALLADSRIVPPTPRMRVAEIDVRAARGA